MKILFDDIHLKSKIMPDNQSEKVPGYLRHSLQIKLEPSKYGINNMHQHWYYSLLCQKPVTGLLLPPVSGLPNFFLKILFSVNIILKNALDCFLYKNAAVDFFLFF